MKARVSSLKFTERLVDEVLRLPLWMDEVMLSKAGLATVMPVRNMDRAIRFYTKILGGSVNMRAEGDRRNYFASVSLGKDQFWLVKPEKREKRDLAYTTFIVKDMKRTVAGLRVKGLSFYELKRWIQTQELMGRYCILPMGQSLSSKTLKATS